MTALHGAIRALKLYPLENETVQHALDEVHTAASGTVESEGSAKLRLVGDFFFLNEARLRLEMRTFSTFGAFSEVLGSHCIGSVEILPGMTRDEWAPFLSLLVRDPSSEDPFVGFIDRLSGAPVLHIDVQPESEEWSEEDGRESMKAAKRTYAQSVAVAKNILGDVRLGLAANIRTVKRAVQNIVDQVLSNEPSMVTLTTLRDFDEYTFTHCVNVCIFSVVIGQRLGLDKSQLYELGMSGLLHDIGKMRTGADIINKPGKPTEEGWLQIKRHPTEGLLLLFDMGGFADVPYRQMLVAYEHHMRIDMKGYPQHRRERTPRLFSRIVAVADGFDAATSVRSYQYTPKAPDKVLREMKENPQRGFDPLVVKALINATGVFPIGTLVVLDNLGLAIVSGVNQETLHLPIVKQITDANGVSIAPPREIDLSEVDPETGKPVHYIVKTVDPQRYRIRVSDYLL